MAQRIPIQLHVANALQWLGTLYRSPADALKEHVSNAIDEHVKARLAGTAADRCAVVFTLDRKSVVIDYPYGMSRTEFETALRRVADSAKRAGDARTIGRLGIGIFSFQQIGRKCTFLSRKTAAAETLRVVLKEASDEAVVENALAREALHQPGLRVVISELKFDPTRSRGPLAPDALRRYLAEKFEAYLREGWLTIAIRVGIAEFLVTPSKIHLPRLLADLREVPLPRRPQLRVRFDLYFDPSGRGRVGVRHHGVTIVESLADITAYGLEESAWAGGSVRGFIDADFLTPLPARSGFDEDETWVAFLDLLDGYLPTLQAELEIHLASHRAREAEAIADRALRSGQARTARAAGSAGPAGERQNVREEAARDRSVRRCRIAPVAARAAHRLRGSPVRERVARAQPLRQRSRAGEYAASRLPAGGDLVRCASGLRGADDRQGVDRVERPQRPGRRFSGEAAGLLVPAAGAKAQARPEAGGRGASDTGAAFTRRLVKRRSLH